MTAGVTTSIADRLDAITYAPSSMPDPPHEVVDYDKFRALVANMLERGWVGPPVVVDEGDYGLTGSHRIAAVRECRNEHGAELAVPRVQVADLAAEFGLDWDALLGEQLQIFESPIAAAGWAAKELTDLLPAEVVEYLGYEVML